ncbi:MAG TPA: 7-cyano-7-deazaguanine synthase QueC [Sphingomicrobium sp.]|nr:7-cyano-7-deazaguanine synthase QueC [Sphingomicrobium sp.]
MPVGEPLGQGEPAPTGRGACFPSFCAAQAVEARTMSGSTRKQAVVLLSGGLDSMVCAGLAREAGFDILALTIDYHQRHRIELEAAARIARALDAKRHIVLPLDLSRLGGSALTGDGDIPKDGLTDDIPVTYVPARNTIFLSICLGWAEAAGARDLYIGVNALDFSGYPDCRPEFVAAFERLANIATRAGVEGDPFTLHTPLLAMTKADIAREAARLGLDPGMSWSCYDPTADERPCGQCDSCRLRSKGFAEAGLEDAGAP